MKVYVHMNKGFLHWVHCLKCVDFRRYACSNIIYFLNVGIETRVQIHSYNWKAEFWTPFNTSSPVKTETGCTDKVTALSLKVSVECFTLRKYFSLNSSFVNLEFVLLHIWIPKVDNEGKNGALIANILMFLKV